MRCLLTVPARMLGAHGTKGDWDTRDEYPGKSHAARRTRVAVLAARQGSGEQGGAELPRTQFDPQARRQYSLELAALMGKVELLLSTLRHQASDDPGVRRGATA